MTDSSVVCSCRTVNISVGFSGQRVYVSYLFCPTTEGASESTVMCAVMVALRRCIIILSCICKTFGNKNTGDVVSVTFLARRFNQHRHSHSVRHLKHGGLSGKHYKSLQHTVPRAQTL